MRDHLVAVDIGTASARAGLFDRTGKLLAKAAFPIAMIRPAPDRAEHDSDDIWQAICRSVRAVLAETDKAASDIAAIGFDATCSLVIRGPKGEKRVLTRDGKSDYDTIVWLDHRARSQAAALSTSGHPLVARAGGRLSPEMAIPKLMWLKENRPDLWQETGLIFDLADYASFRATGLNRRSSSTLAAKWSYRPELDEGWDASFLDLAGLDDLFERTGVPQQADAVGTCLGCLTAEAAQELGLDRDCKVAPGLVDAYAGTLGLLGGLEAHELAGNPALIAGTSSCVAWLSADEPQPLPAFWGPYKGVAAPDLWLMEGGQSAAGALLDHMVRMHAAGGEPDADLHARIIAQILVLRERDGDCLGHPIDVLPDFHGNRSPLGDPEAWGMVSGLRLDTSFDGLCRIYWRTAVGIACGIREILERVERLNGPVEHLHIAGGHARNPLLVALYSDMTGRPVSVPKTSDPVLLGTAINAAAGAGLYASVSDAARAMAPEREIRRPDPGRRQAHEKDYRRYQALARFRAEMMTLY